MIVSDELFGECFVWFGIGCDFDDGFDFFVEFFVWYVEDCDVGDVCMIFEYVFDFGWIDVYVV